PLAARSHIEPGTDGAMNAPNEPPAANPLLDFEALPRFGEIGPEHVGPAVDCLLAEARTTIEHVASSAAAPQWESFVVPLADTQDRLERVWGQVNHLNAVVNTPALREAYNANLPKITAFHTDIAHDKRLFSRYRDLAASPAFAAYDGAQRKLVENTLRDFRLSGAELPDDKKARFKAIEEELARSSARFEDNVLDATNAYGLFVADEGSLAGVPDDVLTAAKLAAESDGKPGWKLTLHMPCYLPVTQYADNRDFRARLHRVYVTRASELGAKPEWDNTPVITRILALRREAALLLGYRNYAELSLVPKMANTADEVLAFLRDLGRRATTFAERDYAELSAFAESDLGLTDFAPWDLAY